MIRLPCISLVLMALYWPFVIAKGPEAPPPRITTPKPTKKQGSFEPAIDFALKSIKQVTRAARPEFLLANGRISWTHTRSMVVAQLDPWLPVGAAARLARSPAPALCGTLIQATATAFGEATSPGFGARVLSFVGKDGSTEHRESAKRDVALALLCTFDERVIHHEATDALIVDTAMMQIEMLVQEKELRNQPDNRALTFSALFTLFTIPSLVWADTPESLRAAMTANPAEWAMYNEHTFDILDDQFDRMLPPDLVPASRSPAEDGQSPSRWLQAALRADRDFGLILDMFGYDPVRGVSLRDYNGHQSVYSIFPDLPRDLSVVPKAVAKWMHLFRVLPLADDKKAEIELKTFAVLRELLHMIMEQLHANTPGAIVVLPAGAGGPTAALVDRPRLPARTPHAGRLLGKHPRLSKHPPATPAPSGGAGATAVTNPIGHRSARTHRSVRSLRDRRRRPRHPLISFPV